MRYYFMKIRYNQHLFYNYKDQEDVEESLESHKLQNQD